MGNCKDCEYWARHETIVSGFTPSKGVKVWHTCEAVDTADWDEAAQDHGFALYVEADDDSGLSAVLKTGALFGCTKFVKVEEE